MTTAASLAIRGCPPYPPFLMEAVDVERAAALYAARRHVVLGPAALAPTFFADLLDESLTQRTVACWPLNRDAGVLSTGEDTTRAHLGPLVRTLLASGAARALLQAICGHPVLPSWSASCLTFYDAPGQYLGTHVDKDPECRVALLIYLAARWPGTVAGPGCQLHVLAEDERRLVRVVTAWPNRVVVLCGSQLPHYRPPLAEGEAVALVAACYGSAPGDSW